MEDNQITQNNNEEKQTPFMKRISNLEKEVKKMQGDIDELRNKIKVILKALRR